MSNSKHRKQTFQAVLFKVDEPCPEHGKAFSREMALQIVSELNKEHTLGPYDPQTRAVNPANAFFFVKRAWIDENGFVTIECETVENATTGIPSLVEDGRAKFGIHVAGMYTSVVDPQLRPDNFYFCGLTISTGIKP